MEITKEYFQKELTKFREIMGDRRFSVEDCSNALRGLLMVYINYEPENEKEKETAKNIMLATCEEHDRRLALRLIHEI